MPYAIHAAADAAFISVDVLRYMPLPLSMMPPPLMLLMID